MSIGQTPKLGRWAVIHFQIQHSLKLSDRKWKWRDGREHVKALYSHQTSSLSWGDNEVITVTSHRLRPWGTRSRPHLITWLFHELHWVEVLTINMNHPPSYRHKFLLYSLSLFGDGPSAAAVSFWKLTPLPPLLDSKPLELGKMSQTYLYPLEDLAESAWFKISPVMLSKYIHKRRKCMWTNSFCRLDQSVMHWTFFSGDSTST